MCEHCGRGGLCAVCGFGGGDIYDEGSRSMFVGDVRDNKRVERAQVGWEFAEASTEDDDALPVAAECGHAAVLSREELRALDGSLALDASLGAESAVREFAESLVVDVGYALRQCRRGDASRAGDALELIAALVRGACRPL